MILQKKDILIKGKTFNFVKIVVFVKNVVRTLKKFEWEIGNSKSIVLDLRGGFSLTLQALNDLRSTVCSAIRVKSISVKYASLWSVRSAATLVTLLAQRIVVINTTTTPER